MFFYSVFYVNSAYQAVAIEKEFSLGLSFAIPSISHLSLPQGGTGGELDQSLHFDNGID